MREQEKRILLKYIPEQSVDIIQQWIYQYKIQLKVTKPRSTKLGDYRPPNKQHDHRVTINKDLNPYSFLITLVHEIAHALCWNEYKRKVKPHGKEWKQIFKTLMKHFIQLDIFPNDVHVSLMHYMQNPLASSCSDTNLMRTIRQHDAPKEVTYLENIPYDTLFSINEKRIFIKGNKLRKRFKCMDVKNKRYYLINPLTEVQLIAERS